MSCPPTFHVEQFVIPQHMPRQQRVSFDRRKLSPAAIPQYPVIPYMIESDGATVAYIVIEQGQSPIFLTGSPVMVALVSGAEVIGWSQKGNLLTCAFDGPLAADEVLQFSDPQKKITNRWGGILEPQTRYFTPPNGTWAWGIISRESARSFLIGPTAGGAPFVLEGIPPLFDVETEQMPISAEKIGDDVLLTYPEDVVTGNSAIMGIPSASYRDATQSWMDVFSSTFPA